MRPVIFLDIDGVLYDMFKKRWYEKAIPALNNVARSCKADIVISSTWRINPGMDETVCTLKSVGLEADIIGHTHFFENDPMSSIIMSKSRGEEIQDYIDENGIKSYVILDDTVITGHEKNFVKVNSISGFDDNNASLSISILATNTTTND